MADYYERVLQYAICGNGVLLVGSGASTEMGYPSWFNLKIAVDVKCACGLGIAFRGTARA